jgi:hypothetical protein
MKSPQELIDHVVSIVQQKAAKNMRCFYSIKIFKNDATTELIERKAGADEFLQDIQNIISLNKPDTVIVELYRGTSRKVKTPEAEFYINLTGKEVSFPVKVEPLSGFDNSLIYSELRRNFDQQLQGVKDLAGLHSALAVSQLELKHTQSRVKELEDDLKTAEEYIEQLEGEKSSRPALSGTNGLNLVDLGSYWLEGVLRRNPGILAGTLGMTDEQAKGLFNNNQNPKQLDQGSASGSIKPSGESKELTERDQLRVRLVEEIAGFLRQLSDYHLRLVYELMCAAGKDLSALEKMMTAVGLELPQKDNSQKTNS